MTRCRVYLADMAFVPTDCRDSGLLARAVQSEFMQSRVNAFTGRRMGTRTRDELVAVIHGTLDYLGFAQTAVTVNISDNRFHAVVDFAKNVLAPTEAVVTVS